MDRDNGLGARDGRAGRRPRHDGPRQLLYVVPAQAEAAPWLSRAGCRGRQLRRVFPRILRRRIVENGKRRVKPLLKAVVVLLCLAAAVAGIVIGYILTAGLSARDEPTAIESFMARNVRRAAIARRARA